MSGVFDQKKWFERTIIILLKTNARLRHLDFNHNVSPEISIYWSRIDNKCIYFQKWCTFLSGDLFQKSVTIWSIRVTLF